MIGLTHALAGALVATAIAPGQGAAVMVGAVAGLIPDIDEPRSTLGSRIPMVSAIFRLLLGHRGITHTALFALLLSAGGWALGPSLGLDPLTCALVALLAALSHVALDSLTPAGTQGLWPLPARLAGPIRTGSLIELPVTALLAFWLWSRLKGA